MTIRLCIRCCCPIPIRCITMAMSTHSAEHLPPLPTLLSSSLFCSSSMTHADKRQAAAAAAAAVACIYTAGRPPDAASLPPLPIARRFLSLRRPARPPGGAGAEGGDLVTGHSLPPHSRARPIAPRGVEGGASKRGPARWRRRRSSIGQWPRRAPIGQEKCARIFTASPIWTPPEWREGERECWTLEEGAIEGWNRDFTQCWGR